MSPHHSLNECVNECMNEYTNKQQITSLLDHTHTHTHTHIFSLSLLKITFINTVDYIIFYHTPHAVTMLKKAAVFSHFKGSTNIFQRTLSFQTPQSIRYHFTFLFSRCWVRIQAQRPATVIKFSVIFLSPFRRVPLKY